MTAITIAEVDIPNDNRNIEVIERYIDQKKRALSPRRKKKIRGTLKRVGRCFRNPLSSVTKQEIEDFLDELQADDILNPKNGEPYKHPTKVDFRKIPKAFFIWLHPEDKEFASWIKCGNYRVTVGPDDILTPDELSRMFEVCKTPSDRARLAVLYESAARPFEFLALMRSDIEFDEVSASLHIRHGKGDFPREITLLQNANPLLKSWIFNEHPSRDRSDFPVWVYMSTNKHPPLQQVGLREFVEKLAADAKITKRVTPYTLRHTRLTDLARQGANEALLCDIAGWRMGSKMPSVYIHLSKRDQKPMLQKILGFAPVEIEKAVQRPKKCESCGEINVIDAKVCARCRMALDTKTAAEMIKKESEKSKTMEREIATTSSELRNLKVEMEDYRHEVRWLHQVVHDMNESQGIDNSVKGQNKMEIIEIEGKQYARIYKSITRKKIAVPMPRVMHYPDYDLKGEG